MQGAVRYGLAAADVNADGVPELFVSTETGGVSSYAVRNSSTPTLPAPPRGASAWPFIPTPPAPRPALKRSGLPARCCSTSPAAWCASPTP